MGPADRRGTILLAAVLSLAACAGGGGHPHGDGGEHSHVAPVAAPPAEAQRGPSLSPAISSLMTEKLNPALSRISFNLFHKPDPDHEQIAERAEAIAVMADDLLAVAPDEELFRDFIVQLKNNATQLVESAAERNRETEIHWFWHLRTSCRDCHDVYRFKGSDDGAH